MTNDTDWHLISSASKIQPFPSGMTYNCSIYLAQLVLYWTHLPLCLLFLIRELESLTTWIWPYKSSHFDSRLVISWEVGMISLPLTVMLTACYCLSHCCTCCTCYTHPGVIQSCTSSVISSETQSSVSLLLPLYLVCTKCIIGYCLWILFTFIWHQTATQLCMNTCSLYNLF